MLNRIKAWSDDGDTYETGKKFYQTAYNNIDSEVKYVGSKTPHHRSPDERVKGAIMLHFSEDFDEEGMDKFIMLVSGMLWAIEHDGIADDDPESLAYNTWLALKDFSTGNYDDLFTPEDLILVKQDVKTLYDYFDKHPLLKGD